MKKESTLVFTGDIGFDKYMDGKWNDPDLIAPEVLAFLHSGDHVIANVEGAMLSPEEARGAVAAEEQAAARETAAEGAKSLSVDGKGQQSEKPAKVPEDRTKKIRLIHTMNPAAGVVLDRMHADIWNLCNNHICDAGNAGVAATLAEAARHGAVTIGAGRNHTDAAQPLLLPEAGGIGLFSVGYRFGCKEAGPEKAGCVAWNDFETIAQNIRKIKETCRWCILVVHGGEEFTAIPSPYVRDRYLKFLAMGVDIIVSHHPHVPMNYETVGEKIIFYSLGNFIFDTDYQRAQYNTEKGILVRLRLSETDYTWDAMGVQVDRGPEHIVKAPLPAIFTDVDARNFALLTPLEAAMLVAAYKRRQIFLDREHWEHATQEQWEAHFLDPKRSGRVPGEALDFQILWELAKKAPEGAWKRSTLEGVKNYILEQM